MKTLISALSTANMKSEISLETSNTAKVVYKRYGISLAEILMALLILAMAVLPAIGTFSQYYGTATRQMEQEIALKLGEAVINVMMTLNYPKLVKGEIPTVPLNLQLPSGAYTGTLDFDGNVATGTTVVIGKAQYKISARIDTVFRAQNIQALHDDAMELKYVARLPGPGGVPPAVVASYSCFDDLITIKVRVDFGGAKPVELSTFRADMTR